MKSQFETLSFLSQYRPKTDIDGEFIEAFLTKRFQIPSRSLKNTSDSSLPTLDAQSFIQWFKNGQSGLKIARYGTSLVLTGKVTLEDAQIIGKLQDNIIEPCDLTVPQSDLSEATPEETEIFRQNLVKSKLQPSPDCKLIPKYIPDSNERVVFYTIDHSVEGVGVVRSVDETTGEIELYCYFIYPTATTPKRLGYSMHEPDIVNLQDFIFESAGEQTPQSALGNTVSCFRRLQRELETEGKIWKDRMCRIEPTQYKQDKGGKYWYIDDKLKVVQSTDEGTPTPRFRYLCGNYFTDHMTAVKMLGKISELFRNYLATPEWPEVKR